MCAMIPIFETTLWNIVALSTISYHICHSCCNKMREAQGLIIDHRTDPGATHGPLKRFIHPLGSRQHMASTAFCPLAGSRVCRFHNDQYRMWKIIICHELKSLWYRMGNDLFVTSMSSYRSCLHVFWAKCADRILHGKSLVYIYYDQAPARVPGSERLLRSSDRCESAWVKER